MAMADDRPFDALEPRLHRYQVIRVADEIVVDLMRSAGGIVYEEAAKDVVTREVDGVPIPFASPRLLWRTFHRLQANLLTRI